MTAIGYAVFAASIAAGIILGSSALALVLLGHM